MGQDTNEIRGQIDATRERMGDTVDAISYKADVPARIHDKIEDTTQRAKDSIKGSVDAVADRVRNVDPVGMARENPLGLMLVSAGLGFIVGSLLPITDIENEKLGPIADDMKEKAQEMGSQAIERGKSVIRDTVDAAQKSTQEQFSQQ